MRLFVGEENWHNAYMGRVHVRLNGRKIDKVIGADEDRGYVLALVKDAEGDFIIEPSGESVMEQTLHGEVEIVFDKPPSQLIREYNEARMAPIRREWRRFLTLDRLPMPWHAFNKRASQYFRAVRAEQQTIVR